MKVYLLYRGKELLCVCDSKEKAIGMAEDDAASALLFEKFGDATNFKSHLSAFNKAYINDVWYSIKEKIVL